jgi:acyl carrier protein
LSTDLAGIERRLAEVWTEVLGFQRVALTDNFFDIGGNSLLAVRIISRAEEVFGVHIPVLALLATGDVHEMAVEIQQVLRHAGGEPGSA